MSADIKRKEVSIMKKKLNFLVMLVCLLALSLVFGSCDNGNSVNGTAPELTDFIVLLIPDVNNPQWQPQNEFTTTDKVQAGIKGTDPDKDVKKFVFTIKRSDGTVFAEKEMDSTPKDVSFTRYFGSFIFPAGVYTAEVYAVDSKDNKSNTLTVNVTVN
jgi:hypothetical protein